jgi:Uma2 family endonuclease
MVDAAAILDELEQNTYRGEQMSFEQFAAVPTRRPAHPRSGGQSAPVKSSPSTSVTGRHQDIKLYLTVMIKAFVEMTDAGLVRDAPFQVLLPDGQIYQPDIVFVANSNFDRVHETYLEGPPDIAVEIVSVETTAADRGDKFVAYESMGVREYWLIDPVRELVNLYHLGPDERYDEFQPDTAGRLRSRVLRGFVLDPSQLWRRVLPTIAEAVELAQAMLSQR